MHRLLSLAVLAGGCVLLAAEAAAQTQPPVDTRFSFDLIAGSVKPGAAEEVGVSTQGFGIQVNTSVTAYRYLAISLDVGILGLKDERPFRENTTEGEKSSSIDGGMYSLAAGLRTPSLALGGATAPHLSAGVNAGVTGLDMDRTIMECVDCTNENLKLRAGTFLEPALHLTFGRGGLSARLRMYNSDSDFGELVMIGYSYSVGSRNAKAPELPDDTEAPAGSR